MHRGGKKALREVIKENGHDFTSQGYTESPGGRLAGVGSGTGYLGYRTFRDEVEARQYLKDVGVIPVDCP